MIDQAILDTVVRVEVTDESIIPGRSGVKDGRAWTIPPKHPCYVHQGDRYPIRLELPVPEHGRPRPGMYLMAGSVLKVGATDGRVKINFDERDVVLISVEEFAASLAKPPLKAAS